MKAYLERLKPLSLEAGFKTYLRLRASLLCLSHARPDLVVFASLIGFNTEMDYDPRLVKEINEKLMMPRKLQWHLLTLPPTCSRFSIFGMLCQRLVRKQEEQVKSDRPCNMRGRRRWENVYFTFQVGGNAIRSSIFNGGGDSCIRGGPRFKFRHAETNTGHVREVNPLTLTLC